jgi:hypothetical protein
MFTACPITGHIRFLRGQFAHSSNNFTVSLSCLTDYQLLTHNPNTILLYRRHHKKLQTLDAIPLTVQPCSMPDLLEQPPLNSANLPLSAAPPHSKRILFTKETARAAALKSVLARSIARSIKAAAPLEPPPIVAKPLPAEPPTDNYNAERMARVRQQLDKVDSMLLKAGDPQNIERLSRSAMSLSEQLRILQEKPLPGSRKPPAAKRERGPTAWESFTERPVIPASPVGQGGGCMSEVGETQNLVKLNLQTIAQAPAPPAVPIPQWDD